MIFVLHQITTLMFMMCHVVNQQKRIGKPRGLLFILKKTCVGYNPKFYTPENEPPAAEKWMEKEDDQPLPFGRWLVRGEVLVSGQEPETSSQLDVPQFLTNVIINKRQSWMRPIQASKRTHFQPEIYECIEVDKLQLNSHQTEIRLFIISIRSLCNYL